MGQQPYKHAQTEKMIQLESKVELNGSVVKIDDTRLHRVMKHVVQPMTVPLRT
jgi:hypothetical protein